MIFKTDSQRRFQSRNELLKPLWSKRRAMAPLVCDRNYWIPCRNVWNRLIHAWRYRILSFFPSIFLRFYATAVCCSGPPVIETGSQNSPPSIFEIFAPSNRAWKMRRICRVWRPDLNSMCHLTLGYNAMPLAVFCLSCFWDLMRINMAFEGLPLLIASKRQNTQP
jgi:hypothetical protein